MIIANNIHKSFGTVEVLKGASLTITEPSLCAILGKSGSGKSTFLQILGTLDQPDKGELSIHGLDTLSLSEQHLANLRNEQIGFIFQFHHLLSEFTALENVCIPYYINGRAKAKAEVRAKELLDYLELSHRLDHKPSQLSGGEQQRVAVARALMNDPEIILADEPTGNLDQESSQHLMNKFIELNSKFDKTVIIVTHNADLANQCDRIFSMNDGILQT